MEQITEQRFIDRLIHVLANPVPLNNERPLLPGEVLALAARQDATHRKVH
jgi:hypothetical protein